MFPFTRYRKFYFVFSGILTLASVLAIIFLGFRPGIEFTGGSLWDFQFKEKQLSSQEIREKLQPLSLEARDIVVQELGGKIFSVRLQSPSEDLKEKAIELLGGKEQIETLKFEAIGPIISKELQEKALLLTLLALLGILIYIAVAFYNLKWPISSLEYGLIALIALAHDLLILVGIVVVLGHFYGVAFNIPILVALLTVAGYSVNDTVIIFDRIRENLRHTKFLTFEDQVNLALNQTFSRSVNTALTTLLVLLALIFFGGQTLFYFALTLIIGIVFGAYSSIFIAAPLLVTRWKSKQKILVDKIKKE